MPRTARILIPDEPAVYHVMSRTALDGYPFEDVEKNYLVSVIKQYSRLYLCEILGFSVMGNHFHLLVKMIPETCFSDAEIKKRYEQFYGEESFFSEGRIPFLRKKWSSLSEFVKEIKQTFSRFYNRRHGRFGFLWGGRFKSVIVENGQTLINCLAYIDLNPVRAGLVEKPEAYRWNSLGYHVQTSNKDDFLSLDFGLEEFGVLDTDERLRQYRRFVYETGAVNAGKGERIEETIVEKERKKDFRITRADRFRHRTRYFTDSGIIGTREFIRKNFKRFQHLFNTENDRPPKRVQGLDGIYSLKRLGA